jgi:hypothetical protein
VGFPTAYFSFSIKQKDKVFTRWSQRIAPEKGKKTAKRENAK